MKHSYYTAWTRGMEKLAGAFGVNLKTMVADWTVETQAKQVDQAIREKPDFIILSPCATEASVQWFKKINKAGIPVVCSNIQSGTDSFRYILSYTGVDNWGSYRNLARHFAELMDFKGGYCVAQHLPESTVYNARTFALITELKKIAPQMVCLEKESTNLACKDTFNAVDRWIGIHGARMKGIVSADDSDMMKGIIEAVEKNGRQDIIRVSQGNSEIGMNFIRQGKLHAVNLQSAETDGALPMEVAVDYFNGLAVQPIRYLPKEIITIENVDSFLPPQW